MIVVRIAFWLLLIFLLLPGSRQDKQNIYEAADRTVKDIGDFCARNPQVCLTGRTLAETVVQKVRVGTEMIEDMITGSGPAADPRTLPAPYRDGAYAHPDRRSDSRRLDTGSPSQHTLNADDLLPAWRGPGAG